MTKRRNASTSDTKKTYILGLKNGNTRKVTVPASWKVTYGSVVPYESRQSGRHSDYAIRFYEGSKENLRAVMTDVVSIRDASMEIMERRTKIQRKVLQKGSDKGARNVEVEARVSEWVNPDAEEDDSGVPSEYLQIADNSSKVEF